MTSVRLVLLGPPGAGKGSLASLYKRRLGFAHLSTGEIFRKAIARNTPVGRRVKRYVTNGRLVPNDLVVSVMAAQLTRTRRKGFVLDGFPRTQGQAAGLNRVLGRLRLPLDAAVYLTSPRALLIRRLSGRRVCSRCGANYHIRTMRPRRLDRCDRCRGRLVVRKDDQPATIRKRLMIDRKAATPLLSYYRRHKLLYPVNGAGNVETVYQRTIKLFERQGWVSGHDRAQKRRRA